MDPLNVSVAEAARVLGIGVTTTKALIRTGKLLSYHEGRRRLVPVAAIREYHAQRIASVRSKAGGFGP